MKRWHSSGFYFVKIKGEWYSLGVTDLLYPEDVKPLGGGEKKENYPDKTLRSEFNEKTDKKLLPLNFKEIHIEVYGKYEEFFYKKFFYLIVSVSGEFALDEELNIIGSDGALLTVRFWDIGEFSKRLFVNYRAAFDKAVQEMIKLDRTFKV